MNIAQRLQDKGRQEGLLQGLEQGIEKGIKQGLQQGREEGVRDAKMMMAQRLFENGVSLELIIESTGLSRDELTFLQ